MRSLSSTIRASPPSTYGLGLVVLGLGNILLCDDGVGVHALRALEHGAACPPNTAFIDGGTLSFALGAAITEAQSLIVFDAAEFGSRSGDVRVFENEAMDTFLGANRKHSVHEVSLLDLMAIAALSDRLPARRALIAIQPQCVDWRDTPTPEVAAAIPRASAAARRLIATWQRP